MNNPRPIQVPQPGAVVTPTATQDVDFVVDTNAIDRDADILIGAEFLTDDLKQQIERPHEG